MHLLALDSPMQELQKAGLPQIQNHLNNPINSSGRCVKAHTFKKENSTLFTENYYSRNVGIQNGPLQILIRGLGQV